MKKWIAALLAAALLAGLAGGCVQTDPQNKAADDKDGSDELGDTLSKAEQVDIYDGNFELVRSLTPGEEMDAFFDALELGDWDVDDEEPEEHYPAEASFVFSQRPTETILGGKPAEDERQEIVRLTIYEGSDGAYLKLLLFSIHMRLPEETLSALREMALPAE